MCTDLATAQHSLASHKMYFVLHSICDRNESVTQLAFRDGQRMCADLMLVNLACCRRLMAIEQPARPYREPGRSRVPWCSSNFRAFGA